MEDILTYMGALEYLAKTFDYFIILYSEVITLFPFGSTHFIDISLIRNNKEHCRCFSNISENDKAPLNTHFLRISQELH